MMDVISRYDERHLTERRYLGILTTAFTRHFWENIFA
jgi:hypothetical protein